MRRIGRRTWLPGLVLVGGCGLSSAGCFLSTDLDDCDDYPHPGCLDAGTQGGAAGSGGIGGAVADGGGEGDADGGCGAVILTTDEPAYAAGQDIQIGFRCAPGEDKWDWIGVYAYGPSGPTPPEVGAYAWDYVDGSQKPGASPATGQVTITAASIGSSGRWPMQEGRYTAYYLPNDAYVAVASIDFEVE